MAARPDVPDVGSEEDARWKKEQSMSWEGGSLTATYGNLIQTWFISGANAFCDYGVDVDRKSYTAKRRNKYSDDSKDVSVPASTYRRYPRHNSSGAAAGELCTIRTEVGQYNARYTGDIQDLVAFMCSNSQSLYGPIWFYTSRGAEYGPYSPETLTGDDA
jgi:hypothetical protein